MVPPIGLVKKILKLRQVSPTPVNNYGYECSSFLQNCSPLATPVPIEELGSPSSQAPSQASVSPSQASAVPFQDSNPSTPKSSMSQSNQCHQFEIPEHWRPEVEECIYNQSLEDSARCEIVRTLVNLLFSNFGKPTRNQCGSLARQLIIKHPFTKDDMGNGYVSEKARYSYLCSMTKVFLTIAV